MEKGFLFVFQNVIKMVKKYVVGVECQTVDYRTVLANSKKEAINQALEFGDKVIECEEGMLNTTGEIEGIEILK